MQRTLLYTILLFLSLALSPADAVAAKSKRLTKRYTNAPLGVVLTDLQKVTGYRLDADPMEVDMTLPVTANYKNASANMVLKRALSSDLEYKVSKGVIHISAKPIPPVTYEVPAVAPSSVEENDTVRLTTWQDTVYTITCRYERHELPVASPAMDETTSSPHALRGHHLQAWLGLGYGSMGYRLYDDAAKAAAGSEHGSLAGQIQLNYAYYFTDNWGLAAGIGMSNYCSYGTLNYAKQWSGQTDTDGEPYTHIARTHDWRERQATYMVDIPVMVQMQYPIAERLRVYAALGAKIGFPVAADRRLTGGLVEHQGQYDRWNLLLSGVEKHDFYSESATDFGTQSYPLTLRLPAAGIMAEVGIARPLTHQLDLLAGLFFNYTCNNIRPDGIDPIGWQRTDQTGDDAYRNHPFMPEYKGEVMSEYVSAVRPWAVGVKVGISWRHRPKAKPAPTQFERVQRCDTAFTLQPRIERYEKVRPAAVQQIVRLMQKSVIWFDLDSAEPKLEPADILDRIAAILRDNPNQKILVYGHASREGNEQYNQRLSERRAGAVTDMLLQKGVRPEQITQRGFAASIAYEQGEHAISLDRRVEIIPVLEE